MKAMRNSITGRSSMAVRLVVRDEVEDPRVAAELGI